jgi:hypothetical protein
VHIKDICAKLNHELAESEARINARLEALEAKFESLLEWLSRLPAPRKDG